MNNKVVAGVNAAQEQIDAWKAEHGEVHVVTVVTDDGKGVNGIFRKPDLDVLALVSKKAETDDGIEAAKALYNNCKLAVDPIMDSDEEVMMAAAKKAGELFRKYKATAKKL